ncbi:hypothetical protein D172_012275 [Pseudoalteromonas sp. Bsw20308]|nr:hypothetical protein D172_012275 [Pseudoalteromonas sp. Bsw20308]
MSDEQNNLLARAVIALKKELPHSTRDNLYTTYQTINNILQQAPFDLLQARLSENIGAYLAQIETRETANPIITNSWVSISSKGNYERMHSHPGSYISGVYYIKAPDNSGDIYFENLEDNMWLSQRTKRENFNTVSYPAIERRLILFNSQVPHHVSQNESEHDRIALSFNVAFS